MYCTQKFRHLVIFNIIHLSFQIYILQLYKFTYYLLKVNISPKTQVDRKGKYTNDFLYAKHFSLIETAQIDIDSQELLNCERMHFVCALNYIGNKHNFRKQVIPMLSVSIKSESFKYSLPILKSLRKKINCFKCYYIEIYKSKSNKPTKYSSTLICANTVLLISTNR